MKNLSKIGIAFIMLFAFSISFGSSDALAQTQEEVFENVDEMPVPPGGMEGFTKYLIENLKYPKAAKENNVEGMVMVTFVVKSDGLVSTPEILRGIGEGCDEEALRVVANSGIWIPGKKDEKIVATRMILPIQFIM
jgi:TonB family protein